MRLYPLIKKIQTLRERKEGGKEERKKENHVRLEENVDLCFLTNYKNEGVIAHKEH